MNSNDGMVMWLLGGTGVFLLYSAYKNQQPQALLTAHINGTPSNAPISNYTATQVPQVTTPDGKTYNTAPGDGGYITSDPPTPGSPYGKSLGGTMLGGFIRSATGQILGVVPATYAQTPQLYIPNVSA